MGYQSHTAIKTAMPYVSFVLFLGIAVGLSRCGDESEKPIPTLVPTPDATQSPNAEAALEELFWIATDVAGIPRDTPFEDPIFQLEMILFHDYDKRLAEIEDLGVEPFLDWPYCIAA